MNSLDKMEDYDRLAKLAEKQAAELETLQYRLQGEFDRGMEAARKEVQTVEVGENSPDSLEDWIGDKPVMRIQFYSDSGDMSVGIWPTSGWEVSADQNGTVLEELFSSLSTANATITMQAEALKAVKSHDDYAGQYSHLPEAAQTTADNYADALSLVYKALNHSAESVAAWEHEKLEPLQRQVAMQRDMLLFCTNFKLNQITQDEITRILRNTQATAEAYDSQHAAKVRNECIQEIEMMRIAHDPRLAVPGDEYYAKAISTLRATNKEPK